MVKGGLTGCEYWLTKGDHAAAVTALNTALGTGPRAAGISGWRNIMQAINSSKALAKNLAVLALLQATYMMDRHDLMSLCVPHGLSAGVWRLLTRLSFPPCRPAITADNMDTPVVNRAPHLDAVARFGHMRPFAFSAFADGRHTNALIDDVLPLDLRVGATSVKALEDPAVPHAAFQSMAYRQCLAIHAGGALREWYHVLCVRGGGGGGVWGGCDGTSSACALRAPLCLAQFSCSCLSC